MKLFICGAGYVGCVTAACCAKMCHDVVITDTNEVKVDCLRAGLSPVVEPRLDDMVAAAVKETKLKVCSTSTEVHAALLDADIAIVCVGTPSRRDGTIDMQALRRVFETIAAAAISRNTPLTVVLRSTALAPILRQMLAGIEPQAALNKIRLVVCPEFLRETTAISDFFNPPFLVAGGDDAEAVAHAMKIFEGIDAPRYSTTLETASMLKYSCNAFHALKMAFANEIDTLAAAFGASGREILNLLMQDKVLNISPAYLRPGFAFGGSCLPKDLRALEAFGFENHEALPLLSAVLPSNRRRLEKALEIILSGPARRLAFVGLSFKLGSDDLRESPYVELAERLIGKGRDVKVFDPDIDLRRLLGANKERASSAPLHLVNLLVGSVEEALAGAEGVVICKAILTAEQLSTLPPNTPLYDLDKMTYSVESVEAIEVNGPLPRSDWKKNPVGPSATSLS